jgi:purine-binding chemotaxis protein CheW
MTASAEAPDTYIVFSVAGTSYALPSAAVRHIEMFEDVTRVPNAASFVDGVVFTRGEVVPVLNLRARFGFERIPATLTTRLIVVQVGERTVGLVADSAREFVPIAAADVQPPNDALAGTSGRYVAGVAMRGDRLILVLDAQRVLDFEEPNLAA